MYQFLFAFLLLFVLSSGYAQPKTATDLVESKIQIENSISKKLYSTIGTTLEKETFEVSVSVDLAEVSTVKNIPVRRTEKRETTAEALLNDIAPLLDANKLIQSYQDEIDDLRVRNEIITQRILRDSDVKKEYAIRSLTIQVGLIESLGEDYTKVFTEWLKKNVETSFGSIPTNIDVALIKSKPIEPKAPTSLFDYISQLQTLIAAFLLFLTVLIGVLLIKRMSSRDASEERSLRAKLQQQLNEVKSERLVEPIEPMVEDVEVESLPQRAIGAFEIEMLKEVHSKVLWVVNQNIKNIKDIMSIWLDSNESGYLKAAILLDVVASQNEKIVKGEGAESILNVGNLIPDATKRNMRSTFDKMIDLSFEDRVKILEEVYWNLLSLKTLGAGYLQRPFDYIASVPSSEIQSVLVEQSQQMKTLAVLHLPQAKQEEFLAKASYELKKEVVESALTMNDVLITDVETASETLKFEVRKKSVDSEVISVRSLVPKLLSSISVIEELTLLKDILPKISDSGRSLKRTLPSLAFIHEWPENKIKSLLSIASNDEVLCMVRMYPDTKDFILNLSPSRTKTIVESDFALEDKMDVSTKNKHLSSLKLKMLKMINKGELDLEVVFADVAKEDVLRVAS